MELRRDFLLAIGTLVTLNLLLAFGMIGLLTRMSPAILEILEENVVSLEASETMLAALLMERIEPGRAAGNSDRFYAALERAKGNVTEPAESEVLQKIERHAAAALAGEPFALEEAATQIVRLSEINRNAMAAADQEAQRLGYAGAWTAVFLGFISLLISLVVIRRLEKRMVLPLTELQNVLDAVRSGDRHRRCRIANPSRQIQHLFQEVNALLDRVSEPSQPEKFKENRLRSQETELQRLALIYFLEKFGKAAALVDSNGKIVASNQETIITLSQPEGEQFRADIESVVEQGTAPDTLQAVPLDKTGWLCIRN